MRGLDKDCDSTIDIQEFASRFEPVFTRLNLKQDVSDKRSFTLCEVQRANPPFETGLRPVLSAEAMEAPCVTVNCGVCPAAHRWFSL